MAADSSFLALFAGDYFLVVVVVAASTMQDTRWIKACWKLAPRLTISSGCYCCSLIVTMCFSTSSVSLQNDNKS